MNREEREKWLAGLQVGDEVFVPSGSRWYYGAIAKVVRFTPTRMIALSNNIMISKDGSIRGNKYSYIRPVTDKDRYALENLRLLRLARENVKFEKLSNEQLKKVLEICK